MQNAPDAVLSLSLLDLAEWDPHRRWQLRPPTEFPGPWAMEWGYDQYGLWQTFELQGIKQKMRYIPPGQFLMGSPKDEFEREKWELSESQHRVTLTRGFWLGETTISQALWKAVMEDNPSNFKGKKEEGLPVDSVSWDAAQTFCHTLSRQLPGLALTLPTEAQWEYACRAGTQTPFSTGWQLTTGQANYNGNYPYQDGPKGKYRQKTVAIDAFAPNPWGLHHMHGNLWEWCQDAPRDYSHQDMVDPDGGSEASDRALRGGGWRARGRSCRSADRDYYSRDARYGHIGLRVAQVEPVKERTAPAAQGLSGARTGKGEGRGQRK